MDAYGDRVGYMGNRLPWDDEGAAACFNGAKLWFSTWYVCYQKQLKPNFLRRSKKFNLMDVDTASKLKRHGRRKPVPFLVIKVDTIFIQHNHAFGINADTRDDRHDLVMTRQNGRSEESYQVVTLGRDDKEWIEMRGETTLPLFKIKACTFGHSFASFVIIGGGAYNNPLVLSLYVVVLKTQVRIKTPPLFLGPNEFLQWIGKQVGMT